MTPEPLSECCRPGRHRTSSTAARTSGSCLVMAGVRVPGAAPLPWLSGFAETNVRLYAVDASGRRGVVFRSLEAARLLPVLVARGSYALPYFWARMAVRHGPRTVAYETSRRWPGHAARAGWCGWRSASGSLPTSWRCS
ncbi:MAG: DUF2071 domain-containing protein [Mycobacteriales bacterium]